MMSFVCLSLGSAQRCAVSVLKLSPPPTLREGETAVMHQILFLLGCWSVGHSHASTPDSVTGAGGAVS